MRKIDLHLERNYTDILLDIHCSEGNQIYVGIKRNVPSQISFECGRASDIFSFFQVQLDNLECVCVQDIIYCVFIPGCNHRWPLADLMKYNFLSVCITRNECSIRCL